MNEIDIQKAPKLGVLCLDYDYTPTIGDIDHKDSFTYEVVYVKIKNLTFKRCQTGIFSPDIIENCKNCVDFLNSQDVSVITGDCGFMIYLQDIVVQFTSKPVVLSSLILIPTLMNCFNFDHKIAVLTANSKYLNKIIDKKFLDYKSRIVVVGCENIKAFEGVQKGEKLNQLLLKIELTNYVKNILLENSQIKCILLECTELPPYSNELKRSLHLPVYGPLAGCNFFMSGLMNNSLISKNIWQQKWDGINKFPYN